MPTPSRAQLARKVRSTATALARQERSFYKHEMQFLSATERLEAAREVYRAAWQALNDYDKEHE